ncbi:hypothetical protein SLEP1_g36724 [Rubroshorea leprosula]|uniref:Uncharacterized protein n=1 Tax=Rubroshorea leprosula TaxID=152421 RepID=A0AAV5KSV7_9ROSI|nr:hypothetical protein SLEP1_g36724 [Rubroshorea leprosula]
MIIARRLVGPSWLLEGMKRRRGRGSGIFAGVDGRVRLNPVAPPTIFLLDFKTTSFGVRTPFFHPPVTLVF